MSLLGQKSEGRRRKRQGERGESTKPAREQGSRDANRKML